METIGLPRVSKQAIYLLFYHTRIMDFNANRNPFPMNCSKLSASCS